MLGALLHWLATPISGASDHLIAMPLAWHGRLMVLATGLLTPPLIIVARFFKVTPQQDWPRQLDNPFCSSPIGAGGTSSVRLSRLLWASSSSDAAGNRPCTARIPQPAGSWFCWC